VPPHLAGIGRGVLTTLQQSGVALGGATRGTLFLGLAGTDMGTAFAVAVGIQAALALVLAAGSRTLPAPQLPAVVAPMA
jgi:hypothetical protein